MTSPTQPAWADVPRWMRFDYHWHLVAAAVLAACAGVSLWTGAAVAGTAYAVTSVVWVVVARLRRRTHLALVRSQWAEEWVRMQLEVALADLRERRERDDW